MSSNCGGKGEVRLRCGLPEFSHSLFKRVKAAVAGLIGDDGAIAGVFTCLLFTIFLFRWAGRDERLSCLSLYVWGDKGWSTADKGAVAATLFRVGFVLRDNTQGSASFRTGSTRNPGLSDAIPLGCLSAFWATRRAPWGFRISDLMFPFSRV